jgi:hypothetical protein
MLITRRSPARGLRLCRAQNYRRDLVPPDQNCTRINPERQRARSWRDLRPSGIMVLWCSRGTRKAMLKRTMSVIGYTRSSSLASGRVSLIRTSASGSFLRSRRGYILDPADMKGPAYPSGLHGLTNNEIARFGGYRTALLILQPWDRWNGRRCCGRAGPH